MSVTFYKSNSKHEPVEEIVGTIEQLATYVHDDAAVEWDRFMVEHDIPIGIDLRFVCLAGVWRAFHTGEGNKFIAQWWWRSKPGEPKTGEWRNVRTKAMSESDIKRALESGVETEDLIAALAAGYWQDVKREPLREYKDPVAKMLFGEPKRCVECLLEVASCVCG